MDMKYYGRRGVSPIAITLIVVGGILIFGVAAWYLMSATNVSPAPLTSVNDMSAATTTPTTTASIDVVSREPSVLSLNPASGPPGTVVTITGQGFAAANTVKMKNLVANGLKNIRSTDGKTIKFTIPKTLGPDCAPKQPCAQFLLSVTPGVYDVTVISDGTTRDAGPFNVTPTPPTAPVVPPPTNGQGFRGVY